MKDKKGHLSVVRASVDQQCVHVIHRLHTKYTGTISTHATDQSKSKNTPELVWTPPESEEPHA
jgi:hypothetical protein